MSKGEAALVDVRRAKDNAEAQRTLSGQRKTGNFTAGLQKAGLKLGAYTVGALLKLSR